jgi:DNA-binding response OmpR family regulator
MTLDFSSIGLQLHGTFPEESDQGRGDRGGIPPAPRGRWAARRETLADKNRLNVLVVDQDEATVLDLKEWLTAEGYRAQAITEPSTVLEEIKHGKYQMVLLDVSPPADRGIEMLQRIRAADSDICVITTTAMPTVDVAVRALKSHAFDYLHKPIPVEELQHVVDAAIREKGLLVDIETRLNQVVGSRLRERRGAAGLTLKQLANRTGLSVSLISQIELGKSAASMSTLHKLATALQVKMTYFFETV